MHSTDIDERDLTALPQSSLYSTAALKPGRFWRPALAAALLLAGVIAWSRLSMTNMQVSSLNVELVGRPIAQTIVDGSMIHIEEIKLAPTSWEKLQESTLVLAIDVRIKMTINVLYTAVRSTLGSSDLRIWYEGSHVGTLSTLPMNLGGGGETHATMAGTMVVEDLEKFKKVALAATYDDDFSVLVDGLVPVVLRGKENGCLLADGACATVGTWKIPDVKLAKLIKLKGAQGFPITFRDFQVADLDIALGEAAKKLKAITAAVSAMAPSSSLLGVTAGTQASLDPNDFETLIVPDSVTFASDSHPRGGSFTTSQTNHATQTVTPEAKRAFLPSIASVSNPWALEAETPAKRKLGDETSDGKRALSAVDSYTTGGGLTTSAPANTGGGLKGVIAGGSGRILFGSNGGWDEEEEETPPPHRQGKGANWQPGGEVIISLMAQISNPSSFSFVGLDEMDLDIHTVDEETGEVGVSFVAVRTPPGFFLVQGTSPWWPIEGRLQIPHRESDLFQVSRVINSIIVGTVDIPIMIQMRKSSHRFFDAAAGGLTLPTKLPQLQLHEPLYADGFPYPLVRAVHINLDVPKAIASLTNPFGSHTIKQYAWLEAHMPLQVTAAITGAVATISSPDGSYLARIDVPDFSKENIGPVVIGPACHSSSDFIPVILDGPIPATVALLNSLLHGPVNVSIDVKAFARVAAIRPIVHFSQHNVTVYLGD